MQVSPHSDAPVGFLHGGGFQNSAIISGGSGMATPYAMVPIGQGMCSDPSPSVAPFAQTCFAVSADGSDLVGGAYQYSQQSYQMQPTMVATMPSLVATGVYAGCATAPFGGVPMHAAASCPGVSYRASACQPPACQCQGVGLPASGSYQTQPAAIAVHTGITPADGVVTATTARNVWRARAIRSKHRGPDLLPLAERQPPSSGAAVAPVVNSGITPLASTSLPSQGSAGHMRGSCRPCAFFHTPGCANGVSCPFCHLCDAGERKRRKKEQQQCRKTAVKLRAGRRNDLNEDAQRSRA